jgi:anti-sigma factor RsiW
MTCAQMEELLSAYADGEATPGERRLVARHVEECRACAHRLRLMAGMKASVKKMKAPPAPAALKAALHREVARRRPAPWWSGLFRAPAVRVGFAAAFAGAAVLLVVRSGVGDDSVPVGDLLAAHSEYALTQPLSQTESLYAGLADRIAQGDAHGF